jgi:hypothetical protein
LGSRYAPSWGGDNAAQLQELGSRYAPSWGGN